MVRRQNDRAALFSLSHQQDAAASWYEDIELSLNGAPWPDVDDHVWTLKCYRCPSSAPDLSLSTADSTLTVTETSSATLLSIRCAPSRMSGLCGDYVCDITSTDASPTVDGASRVVLWARGVVTFTKGPA